MASSSHALPVGLTLEGDRRRAKASSSGLESHRFSGISCLCRVRSKAVRSRVTCSSSRLDVPPFRLHDGATDSSRGKGVAFGSILLGSVLPFWVLHHPAAAYAHNNQAYADISSTLAESGFQLFYLGGLLILLGGGSFLVIRQILMRRELELAAKELQERVRTGQASPLECYELGAIMLRKKLYPVARKYLEQAIKKWEDDEQDLAQVYNALGFCYFGDGKVELAIASYEKAVTLSPGYTVAWNNLGQAYEKRKDWEKALKSYEQTLQFDPANKVALACRKIAQEKVNLFKGIPTKL